jgi:small-conductance mechanosensitive channel
LDSIEQIVKSLQGTVENRLGVIEKGLSSQQNEAIQKLTQLLQYERERNQNLLRKNAKLEMMYLHLKQIIEKAREKVQKMRAAKV